MARIDWLAVIFLGAFHGINPGMGWLFAVALGMQQGTARGVWQALPPLALGHAVAVGGVLLIAGLAGVVAPHGALKIVVAAVLIGFGVYRWWRHRHPRYGGMQVGFRDLTVWSMLMASAHGAGLMLVPFVMNISSKEAEAAAGHAGHATMIGMTASTGAMALGIHTLAYLLVVALTAWIVYWKVGLAILRKAWVNLDWVWAGALVVTGLVVLVM